MFMIYSKYLYNINTHIIKKNINRYIVTSTNEKNKFNSIKKVRNF